MDSALRLGAGRLRPRAPSGNHALRILSLFGAAVAIMGAGYFCGLRYNGSPSFPKGFYLLSAEASEPGLGDLVFACPPDTETFREARARHYIGPGTCPGGFTPIIKKVAGRAGDAVLVGATVSVNGVEQPYSAVAALDGKGRPLAAYGSGTVPEGHVLLLSDFYAGSYDSRYFGPLELRQIIGRAKPLLTW
jgi:conjugative transfer signal peptidase TraF